jgi:hypothetical protein
VAKTNLTLINFPLTTLEAQALLRLINRPTGETPEAFIAECGQWLAERLNSAIEDATKTTTPRTSKRAPAAS